tara:strand:+ start:5014 stop:5160 length:147 start_codon:yes stop_codon:yes gene_type:complete
MPELEQFHITEITTWEELPDAIDQIPKHANLRMIVWSVPREKEPLGAD